MVLLRPQVHAPRTSQQVRPQCTTQLVPRKWQQELRKSLVLGAVYNTAGAWVTASAEAAYMTSMTCAAANHSRNEEKESTGWKETELRLHTESLDIRVEIVHTRKQSVTGGTRIWWNRWFMRNLHHRMDLERCPSSRWCAHDNVLQLNDHRCEAFERGRPPASFSGSLPPRPLLAAHPSTFAATSRLPRCHSRGSAPLGAWTPSRSRLSFSDSSLLVFWKGPPLPLSFPGSAAPPLLAFANALDIAAARMASYLRASGASGLHLRQWLSTNNFASTFRAIDRARAPRGLGARELRPDERELPPTGNGLSAAVGGTLRSTVGSSRSRLGGWVHTSDTALSDWAANSAESSAARLARCATLPALPLSLSCSHAAFSQALRAR